MKLLLSGAASVLLTTAALASNHHRAAHGAWSHPASASGTLYRARFR